MTNLQSQVVPAVVLRRTYPAARERVFAAWTNPEIAARLFSPNENKATDIRMDVTTGGAYTITMIVPDGERFVVRGTYLEVIVPERLVMSWRWEEDDPADEYDSLLTLEFHERSNGTELVLTHEKLANVASRDRHEEGWTEMIDHLASVLEIS
jgi:uncharacterized protein YndB with AHSA1/START domain